MCRVAAFERRTGLGRTMAASGKGSDRAGRRGGLATLALLAVGGAPMLAGCDETPAPAPAPVVAAAPAPASGIVLHPQPAGPGGPFGNDPSAPAGTPLCGMAARENDAIAQSLLSRQYAEAGICSSYACYDAATATYIGADGYRHVCR